MIKNRLKLISDLEDMFTPEVNMCNKIPIDLDKLDALYTFQKSSVPEKLSFASFTIS